MAINVLLCQHRQQNYLSAKVSHLLHHQKIIYNIHHIHKLNRCSLKNLSLQCNRFQLSDQASAAFATAVLQDYGILTNVDTN